MKAFKIFTIQFFIIFQTFRIILSSRNTFVYVVGLEGAGHHGVTPILKILALSLNYTLLYRDNLFRVRFGMRDEKGLASYIKPFLNTEPRLSQSKSYRHAPLALIEDSSFPGITARQLQFKIIYSIISLQFNRNYTHIITHSMNKVVVDRIVIFIMTL
jgi:hypothetical protein